MERRGSRTVRGGAGRCGAMSVTVCHSVFESACLRLCPMSGDHMIRSIVPPNAKLPVWVSARRLYWLRKRRDEGLMDGVRLLGLHQRSALARPRSETRTSRAGSAPPPTPPGWVPHLPPFSPRYPWTSAHESARQQLGGEFQTRRDLLV